MGDVHIRARKNNMKPKKMKWYTIILSLFCLFSCKPKYVEGTVEYEISMSLDIDNKNELDSIKFYKTLDTREYKEQLIQIREQYENYKNNKNELISKAILTYVRNINDFQYVLEQMEDVGCHKYDYYIVSIKNKYKNNEISEYVARAEKIGNKYEITRISSKELIPEKCDVDYDMSKLEYFANEVKKYLSMDIDTLRENYDNYIAQKKNDSIKAEREYAEALKIKKQREEEERIRNWTPSSWSEIATVFKKKGYNVLGMFKCSQKAAYAFYTYKGSYYMCVCSFSKNPINETTIMKLKKKRGFLFEYNREGSDMPERFQIEGNDLDTYVFNPDAPYGAEWVYMGSYRKVYPL